MTTIEDALNCVEAQKQNGTYDKNTKIGKMLESYRFFDAHYEPGMHVLYKQSTDGRLFIEMPLSAQSIGIQQRNGSKRTTCYEVWNVPDNLVEKVEVPQ